jgi:hypothetical protein
MSTPKNTIKVAALTPEAIKNRQEFILWVTDFFHGHWEDPSWGRRQVMYEKLAKMANEKMAER